MTLHDGIDTNAISSILICAIYYYLWAILLPHWRNYSLRQEVVTLEGGAQTLQLRKVPNTEIAAWDASHDAAGYVIGSNLSDSDGEKEGSLGQNGVGEGKEMNVVVKGDAQV